MKEKNSYSRVVQSITKWETVNWGEKIKLFQHAVERDITSFLAIGPHHETLQNNSLGTALSESGLSRDEIQLISGIQNAPRTSDLFVSQVEETLQHLKSDYLDLLFIDPHLPTDLVMPSIERLHSQGKVIEVGIFGDSLSYLPKDHGVKARLTSWKFGEETMNNIAASTSGVAEMIWIDMDETERYNEALKTLAEKYKHDPQEIILAWLLQHPLHFHPVIDTNSTGFMDLIARAHHLTLIEEDWQKLPDTLARL